MRRALVMVIATCWAGTAAADPALGHVITAPTAWLPPAGTFEGTAGVDHRGKGAIDVGYGLGDLAGVELELDTDVRACVGCDTPAVAWLGRAVFRVGARSDAWFRGQPALVLGVRTSFAGTASGISSPRVADAFVVASRVLGPVRLHVGVEAIDARGDGPRLRTQVRPIAGLDWTPAQFPKTSVLADVVWVPVLDAAGPRLELLGAWGVRYQALAWGSIDLVVRHRQAEGLAGSTVLVRLNGVWAR